MMCMRDAGLVQYGQKYSRLQSYHSSVHNLGMLEQQRLQFGRSNLCSSDLDQFLKEDELVEPTGNKGTKIGD